MTELIRILDKLNPILEEINDLELELIFSKPSPKRVEQIYDKLNNELKPKRRMFEEKLRDL